jgi:hypothetical protein
MIPIVILILIIEYTDPILYAEAKRIHPKYFSKDKYIALQNRYLHLLGNKLSKRYHKKLLKIESKYEPEVINTSKIGGRKKKELIALRRSQFLKNIFEVLQYLQIMELLEICSISTSIQKVLKVKILRNFTDYFPFKVSEYSFITDGWKSGTLEIMNIPIGRTDSLFQLLHIIYDKIKYSSSLGFSNSMPFGIDIAGINGQDLKILSIARAFEDIFPPLPMPTLPTILL